LEFGRKDNAVHMQVGSREIEEDVFGRKPRCEPSALHQ
jgi:hypothetical protein